MRVLIITGLCFCLILPSCTYDSFEELKKAEVCDTTNVTFNKDIVPLIEQKCGVHSTCHSSTGSDSDVSLANYADVTAVVSTGQFLGAVTHDSNYEPMPKDEGMLDDCRLNTIKAWINQGLKED